MRYYCERCGCELKTDKKGYSGYCPICYDVVDGLITELAKIPDYETPEQYEKRTGKAYPDNGAVFQYRGFWVNREAVDWHWELKTLRHARFVDECYPTQYIVIADPPVPPPETWRPE